MERKGIIKFSKNYENKWSIIFIVLKDFKLISAEFDKTQNVWHLTGISEKFDLIKKSDPIPEYELIFTRNVNQKNVSYKFKKL